METRNQISVVDGSIWLRDRAHRHVLPKRADQIDSAQVCHEHNQAAERRDCALGFAQFRRSPDSRALISRGTALSDEKSFMHLLSQEVPPTRSFICGFRV
jgi:hypothetical protein